jgi:hypothetical protein
VLKDIVFPFVISGYNLIDENDIFENGVAKIIVEYKKEFELLDCDFSFCEHCSYFLHEL